MDLQQLNIDELAEKLIEKLGGSLPEVTLKIFIDEYLSFVKRNRAAKTYEGVRLVCKHLLRYFSPLRKIDTIKLKDAEVFLDSLKVTAPRGVDVYLRVLKGMWNKGIQWNYLRGNVFVKIKLPKRQKNEPDYLQETELEAACSYINNDAIKNAVRFTFYTGIRLGELIKIRWNNIDLEKKILIVGDSNWTTKAKKQRVVPLSEKAVRVLLGEVPLIAEASQKSNVRSKKLEDRFVFGKENGMPYTTDCISKNFKRACRKAGIDERIHFHSLRHSAASMMAKNGAPITAVKDILGHSSIQTTMIYTHSNLETLRDAVNRI